MSTQSVIHNTNPKISKQIDTHLQAIGKKFLLKYRFDVGKEPSMEDIRYVSRLSRIFCSDNCNICEEDISAVKEKINRKLIYNNPEL